MYKSRITAWGIDKKNKTHEARTIMREKQRYDALRQQCLFFVRRFLVDVNDVERFCKRSKIEVGQEDTLQPADVQVLVLRRKLTALSDPSNFKHLRSFFHYYGVLVETCFDQSIWTTSLRDTLDSDTLESCKVVEQSFLDLGTACQLFTRSEHVKGGVYLRSAFWRFPDLLKSTYHETIPCLIQCLTELRRNGMDELFQCIINHLTELADTILPTDHLYHKLLQALGNIQIDGDGQFLEAQSNERKQLYRAKLGDDHLQVIGIGRFRYTSAGQLLEHRPWETIEAAVEMIDARHGACSRRGLAELDSLCAGLQAAERLEEAELMYAKFSQRLGMVDYELWVWKTLESAYHLGDLQYRVGKICEARKTWQDALDKASRLADPHEYHWIPKLLESLAIAAKHLGDEEGAARYQRQLEDVRKQMLAGVGRSGPD